MDAYSKAQVYNYHGTILRKHLEDFKQSQVKYEAAIKADPTFGRAYFQLAILHQVHLTDYQKVCSI